MPTEQDSPDMSFPWSVGELPFVFRYGETPSNVQYGLPDCLSFFLDADRETGLIKQTFSKDVDDALQRAYLHGSILTGAMDASGIGQSYALDFLAFIEAAVPVMEGKRILEIGSGTGYLLSLLRERGADVVGIEPGPQGETAEKRFGIKLIRDFFPSKHITDTFDVVVAYGVLEHLPGPGLLLREIEQRLAPRGVVILAVPNCEPYLQAGDISCLFHEHWSYFTAKSLTAVVLREGFSATIADAGFGGALYCSAFPCECKENISRHAEGIQVLVDYRAKSMRMQSKLTRLLACAKANHKSVGVYVAGRMLNALALIGDIWSLSHLRFFDDNEALHGKYFPGFPFPVEDWAEFLDRPTDLVLIASNTFGHKIRERIVKAANSTVVGWDELFA